MQAGHRRHRDGLRQAEGADRGIDVDDVEAVFNYDIPDENEYYLHRIGRTGRAKRRGAAYTFMTPDDRFRIRDIKKYTHSEIEEILFAADGRLTHKDGSPLAQAADTASTEDI